jgi:pectate lyase
MLSAAMGSLADAVLVDTSGEALTIASNVGPAATLYVTSFIDAVAPGTLRQAVIQANATPGANTIVLRAGIYRLTLAGSGEDAAATGDLDILENLTIQGVGEMQTIIDASALGDRVFDARGANLVIKNATIRGGRAPQGGGVSVVDGNLTLQSCRLIDNIAAGVDEGDGEGGGVYHQNGSLVVQRTRFIGNQAIGAAAGDGGFGRGGAISLHAATAAISKSTFSDNRASGGMGV